MKVQVQVQAQGMRKEVKKMLFPSQRSKTFVTMYCGGNPELYDPTDTCRQTSRPTVGQLTADSLVTNGRQSAD